MYVILIKDGYYVSLYTYGQFAKTYSSIEEAEKAIKGLKEVENKAFGELSIKYQIVEVD